MPPQENRESSFVPDPDSCALLPRFHYSVYGLSISSNIELRGLSSGTSDVPDVSVEFQGHPPLGPSQADNEHMFYRGPDVGDTPHLVVWSTADQSSFRFFY